MSLLVLSVRRDHDSILCCEFFVFHFGLHQRIFGWYLKKDSQIEDLLICCSVFSVHYFVTTFIIFLIDCWRKECKLYA